MCFQRKRVGLTLCTGHRLVVQRRSKTEGLFPALDTEMQNSEGMDEIITLGVSSHLVAFLLQVAFCLFYAKRVDFKLVCQQDLQHVTFLVKIPIADTRPNSVQLVPSETLHLNFKFLLDQSK